MCRTLRVRHHLDSDGGFLDADAIVEHVGAQLDADFYVCGPTPFVEAAADLLVGVGYDPLWVKTERFGATSGSAP